MCGIHANTHPNTHHHSHRRRDTTLKLLVVRDPQGWLEDMEHAAIKKREDEPVRDVWVAVFDMPRDLAKTWKHNEQLADRVERTDNIMHVNTESTQELEKRTVIVSKIPDDHVVAADPDADRQDPALSLTLMELLTVFGDIDVVTVHKKAEGEKDGDSWAFVTYELHSGARMALEAAEKGEVQVPGIDHTSSGGHMVPDRTLRVEHASLMGAGDSVADRLGHSHQMSETQYR